MRLNLDQLLKKAFEMRASDLHLTVGTKPVMRIHGILKPFGTESLKPDDTERMAATIIPKAMKPEFEKNGELDLSYSLAGVSRFRVNVFKQRSCVSLAFRVVPTSIPSLTELKLPETLKTIAANPQGLVLVTGPTGSGKSTTLAAMIDYMNKTMNRHIITLEDPIEYLHKHQGCIIDQREIGLDTAGFSNGLRAALRQDPDVILVGEMRDLETISTAITAAETGHLVLGTLHTSDASSTIDRMIDVFPGNQQPQIRVQLAAELAAVVSQRLFSSADGSGRRAAVEMLINNPAAANLIRNKKIHQLINVMQTSRAEGMCTLDMSIRELLQENVISRDAVQSFLQVGSS